MVWRGKGKGSGVWPSMVTHTRNLSSAFNPSKCTLTAVNTHLEQWLQQMDDVIIVFSVLKMWLQIGQKDVSNWKQTVIWFNVTKTKKLILDTWQQFSTPPCPISINGQPVEIVDSFRYVYIILDNKLSFDHHVTDIHRRCQQSLLIIRKVRFFSVKPNLLLLLYSSVIESIICFSCYFTKLRNRNKLFRITNTS